MPNYTRNDRIKKKLFIIRSVTPIEDKKHETCDNMRRRLIKALVKRLDGNKEVSIKIDGERKRKTWLETLGMIWVIRAL